MLYAAQMGVAYTFFHPVRDINEAYVAGQASAIDATKAMLGPDRLAATAGELAAVTLVDYAVGWVAVTVTLPRLGEFTLTLTNPGAPTADGRVTDYPILVSAGLAPSAFLLTSLDRVRARMQLQKPASNPPVLIQPGEAHPLDNLIQMVISEVSEDYQATLGRSFVEQNYTEYLDGSGTRNLLLTAGPLVSVTSVQSVEYQDDGAGGVTEVLTTVPRSWYVLAGMRSSPRFYGRGRLDLVSECSTWWLGVKRFKVVYVAGFASVPEGIVGLATEDVVYRVMSGEHAHLMSQTHGDGSITYLRPQQMIEARESRLGPYMLEAA